MELCSMMVLILLKIKNLDMPKLVCSVKVYTIVKKQSVSTPDITREISHERVLATFFSTNLHESRSLTPVQSYK